MPTEVLLIDPDNVSRTLIKYHLKRAGYIVHEAANREAAIQFSPYVRPSLIIADESISLEDQPSGASNYSLLYSLLPWVVLTALPTYQRDHCRRAYLAKPALSSQLLSCIAALMPS